MEFSYKYSIYQFPNQKVSTDRLLLEINESAIIIAISRIDTYNNIVDIVFKDELSSDDLNLLNTIVSNHSGDPLPEEPQVIKAEILTEHIEYVESGDVLNKFSAETLLIDISSGIYEKVTDFKWNIPISLKSGTIGVSEDMIGDEMEVHVAPNTLIGAITQDLNIGDTSIYVSSTVIQNIKRGYYLGLYQSGDTGIEISQVLDIDVANSFLAINPSDVSANAGSYVSMCAKIIPYVYFHSFDKIELGKHIPQGQRISKEIPIRVIYKNNNGVAKKISFFVEFLY